MSELSKQALKVENNVEFPNNNAGLITPSKLRTFNEDMIDSTVNQAVYTSDSASWNAQIAAISASAGADTSALNQFTASQLVINTGYNTFTQSADGRLDNLESTTSSLNSSVSQLNQFSASQLTKDTTLAGVTASLQGQLTNIGSQSGSWDNTSLNAFTQSQEAKDQTLSTYTASVDTKFANIGNQSGSWITESETSSFARYDVSNPWSADQNFTNITAVSASFTYVKTTYETSSVIYSSGSNQFGDAADDIQTLYGSVRVMNALTASGLNYPTADGLSGQFMITNGTGTLSFDDVHTMLEAVRYGENITIGDPLYVSGSNGNTPVVWKADASNSAKMPVIYIASSTNVANTNTTAITLGLITGVTTTGYPVGTTVYVGEGGGWSANRPSGSNSIVQPLGIVTKEGAGGSGRGLVLNPGPAFLPNIQTGYTWVGNSNNQPTAVATSSFASLTDLSSLNAFTASQQNLNLTFATTGSNSFNGSQQITGSLLVTGNTFITPAAVSTNASYPVIFVSGSTISKDSVDTIMYNPSTNVLSVSGSTGQSTLSVNGLTYTSVTSSITSTLNKGTVASTDSTGAPTTFKAIQISANPSITGNPVLSGITNPSILTPSSSVGGFIAPIQFQDRSGYTDGRVTFTTPVVLQQPLTASLTEGYVWAGGAGNITKLVATSSFISTINTGSFATTGSNSFFGTNSFSGAVSFTGNAPTIVSQSFSGSVITNLTDIYTNVAPVRQIVTLTSASYAALVSGGTVDENTLYIVSGSTSGGTTDLTSLNAFTASQEVKDATLGNLTGSFATTGSNNFVGNQTLTGSLLISSSATNDLIISGTTVLIGGTFRVTSSTGVVGAFSNTLMSFSSGSTSNAVMNRTIGLYNTSGSSQIGLTAGSTTFGLGPSIFASSGSSYSNYEAIQFQDGGNYTDGRVTFPTPVVLQQALTASLTEGYVWAGGAGNVSKLVATSSFGGGGAAFPYTGDAIITGSLQVTGSFRGFVNNLSVVATTASINMNDGNFFTLNLPTSATTYIEVTNIKAGQTINLQVSQSSAGTGSVTFSPNIKFAGGFDYTATAITGALDLVSFVSFDTNQIIATSVKNLL